MQRAFQFTVILLGMLSVALAQDPVESRKHDKKKHVEPFVPTPAPPKPPHVDDFDPMGNDDAEAVEKKRPKPVPDPNFHDVNTDKRKHDVLPVPTPVPERTWWQFVCDMTAGVLFGVLVSVGMLMFLFRNMKVWPG